MTTVALTKHYAKPGYVYVAYSASTKLYKIGLSSNPDDRIKYMRNRINDETVVLCIKLKTDNMIELEGYLHRQFDLHRRKGEWFALCGQDLEEISLVTDTHVIEGKSIRVSNPPCRDDTGWIELSNGDICEIEFNHLTGKTAKISPPYTSTPSTNPQMATILGKCAYKRITESRSIVVESVDQVFRISRNMLRVTGQCDERQWGTMKRVAQALSVPLSMLEINNNEL